jgi:hypothetical protein
MLSEKDEVPVSIFASRHDASKTGNLFRSFLRHSTQETNMTDIVSIRHGDELLAIIIPAAYHADGIQFFTPGTFSQQLGYMSHPAGYEILPHDHNPVPRTVEWTQEVLFVRSGKVRMDIYAPGSRVYLESRKLLPGDIVLLAHGGHGFVMLEPSEMIEVKQGPYAAEQDKERFSSVSENCIIIRD